MIRRATSAPRWLHEDPTDRMQTIYCAAGRWSTDQVEAVMSACARHLAIAAAAVVASGAAASRAEAAEAVSALSRLAWLSGIWRGQALGGEVEDVYQPLASGEILSTFHLVVNGQTARYELRRIHADGDRIVLQELAFGPSLMPLA